MSLKWLHREGPTWVEKEIITREQFEEIVKLYPKSHPRFSTVLPILASLLVALSILSFVASNWDVIPQWGRLVFLFITLISFYTSGFTVYQKGNTGLGRGLLLLGLITFGASMILIGQMFNMIAYDARLFILWSLAGLALLYLYRDSIFYYATAVLLFTGQFYSTITFHNASWVLFVLTLAGLGRYTHEAKSSVFGYVLAPLAGIQAIILLSHKVDAWSWITLIPVVLYVIGLWLEERPIAKGFLIWTQAFGIIFSIVMVFAHHEFFRNLSFLADPVHFMLLFGILFVLVLRRSRRQPGKWLPLIFFLPFFYFSFADRIYLAAMFVFASSLIYFGDHENQRVKSNIGVFLFMLSSFVGYIQLAWAFLDKSLFFLLGGIVLFFIHWLLRKRRRWLKGEEQSQ